MSIMENAQQLIASADTVEGDGRGAVGQASQLLAEVGGHLQRVRDICEDSTQTAALLLGEGHAGLEAVTISAAYVTDVVLQVQGLLTQLDLEIDNLNGTVGVHADAMRQAGQRAMGGGA